MINSAQPQCITPDWVEMHFRVKDPGIFSTKTELKTGSFRTENGPVLDQKKEGETLPKHFTSGREKVQIKETTFRRKQNGNKFYTDYYEIYHRKKKFGVMLANSRDHRLMPLDDIQIQVINNKLYEGNWLQDMQEMMHNINAEWHNFTRLDIAVDGGDFLSIYDRWRNKKVLKVGRAAVNVYHNNKGDVSGFYIGMSKSKKRMKIYNKSGELNKSNKTYIPKYWKLHGITGETTVERLELTIRNEESKKYKDIDWRKLDQPGHLASIMRSNMDKFCDFRIPNGGKNIARMEKLQLVDWEGLKGEFLPKDTTRPTTEIFSAKVTIKKLFESHCVSQQQVFFDVAFEIAINSDLVEYFSKMQPVWREELQFKLGNNRDGLISDSWLTKFKTYNPGEQIVIYDDVE